MTYYYFFSLPILLLISMLCVLSRTSPAYGAPEYLAHYCVNITIPENSSYQSSLSSLLSSITPYATRDFQFYSPAISSLTSSLSSNAISKLQKFLNISDPIYALHLCRGDINTDVCRDCVATRANFLAKECSRELIAVVWYNECMMRYSNASFFSTMDILNITELERFNQLVNTTMIFIN